jgi:hypothetical protein
VRINIDCDDHLASIAKRWLKGERQRDIAETVGLCSDHIERLMASLSVTIRNE